MSELTLEKVLIKWESKEHSVEEKLDALHHYVFKHVGLKEEPEYYMKHGKFFQRYIAGFISNYFWMLEDMSFILLDPLHIFDILTTFVKELFTHPLKMLKQMWGCWTWSYTHGAFGLGLITACALMSCIIAGAAILIGKGLKAGGVALRTMGKTVSDTFVSTATSLPDQFISMGTTAKNTFSSASNLFKMVRTEPMQILENAKKSILSKAKFGEIRGIKFYANPFMSQNQA